MNGLTETPGMSGEYWDQHGYKSEEEWMENYNLLCAKVDIMNRKLESAHTTDISIVLDTEKIPMYKRITLLQRMIDSMCIEIAEGVTNGKFPDLKHLLNKK